MSSSLFHILNISQSAMLTQLQDLDMTSNNLANINTAGFKSTRGNFQELLNQAELEGTKLSSSQLLMTQGALRSTGNPLDVAVQGEGFFQVGLADGRTAYTRDGQFHIDANRNLVTSSGEKVVWQGQIPQNFEEVAIAPNGAVNVRVGLNWSQAGTLQLSRFANPTGLQGYGQNLWLATPSSGQAQNGAPASPNFGSLQSQAVEAANVNIANEMTNMTVLQRAFQMSTRAFQTTDGMITQAIHMRRG